MNVSDGKENYSQKNNKYRWVRNQRVVSAFGECNVTSMVMMLDYNGMKLPTGIYRQPEDNLAKFIMESKVINKMYKTQYPSLYKEYKLGTKDCYVPLEIHSLLAYGTNLWLATIDKQNYKVQFTVETPIEKVEKIILEQGRAVVVSGRIPKAEKPSSVWNHIVVLVGFEQDTDGNIITVILDDPYGFVDNGGAHYSTGKLGNDNRISYSNFIKWFKPTNSFVKFAHYLVENV